MTLSKENTKAGRSKLARAKKTLTPNELFFFEQAGYSYDPKKETAEQGRIRCAKELAQAEEYAANLNWRVEWQDDWDIGNHRDCYGEDSAYSDREPSTCECARLFDDDDNVLAALGCIDDADRAYRRVIEAELAAEALVHYDREIEVLDAH